jgi:ABC-type transport system involved in multi-copper enzyme maturation permease subunit
MGDTPTRAAPELLHYRAWRGEFQRPVWSVWPVARIALSMMFRRRLFWALYGFGMIYFLLFFFGQYLLAWAESQSAESDVRLGGIGRASPQELIRLFRGFLRLDGSGETFRNFMGYQGYTVMVVLALAGSLLVGNDLRFGTLPFYLSKPLSRWHYLLGKGLAVAVFINLMTTLPALVLWVQFGLLDSWSYFREKGYLALGILAYGAVLTVSLTLILLATATWLRKTVPLIMAWTTLFVFCRLLGVAVVNGLHFDSRWRLIDLWNDTSLIGNFCLGLPAMTQQPAWYEAALVLGGVCTLCLSYLVLRIRAVEVVR